MSNPRRAPSPRATALALVLAAVGLGAVMGVTVYEKGQDDPYRDGHEIRTERPVDDATACLERVRTKLRAVEKRLAEVGGMERGINFESARLELLAGMHTECDELRIFLQNNPQDDEARGLRDRIAAFKQRLSDL